MYIMIYKCIDLEYMMILCRLLGGIFITLCNKPFR